MLVNQYKNRIKRERKVLSAPYSTLDDAVLQPKRARGTSGRRRRFEVLEGVMMCVMGKKSSSWTLNERWRRRKHVSFAHSTRETDYVTSNTDVISWSPP